jgi:hypothetical protein
MARLAKKPRAEFKERRDDRIGARSFSA